MISDAIYLEGEHDGKKVQQIYGENCESNVLQLEEN